MIWLNGSFEDTSKISSSDRGFLLGDRVFDYLYATGKTVVAVLFFNQHWQRLTRALNLVEIDIPYAANDILAACQHLIKHMFFENNNDQSQSFVLRLSVSRGNGGRGLSISQDTKPNWLLTAAPCPPPPNSVSLHVSTLCRPSKNLTSRIKSLSYMDNILARKEAVQAGADEALLLNEKGHVSCAAAANIFVFENNRWVTPLISDGALNGIVRGEILNMNKLDGVPIIEESLTLAQVQEADHLFICNSLTGAVPVIEINGMQKEKSPAMQAISEIHKSG
ncbi:MAG: aminotransferase class IV [Pseudomonadota bacterium]|nr:aminotransferase class IV [Pseudomonadota bacterium]